MKRTVRAKLSASVSLRSKRRPISRLKRLKYRISFAWKRGRDELRDLVFSVELWYEAIRNIEGHLGSAVGSYFRLLRWLFALNLLLSAALLAFVVVPQALHAAPGDASAGARPSVLDFISGKGGLEHSLLFFGSYHDAEIAAPGARYYMPFAYFYTMLCLYLMCFVVLCYRTAASYRRNFIEPAGGLAAPLAAKLFCGWDFGIASPRGAARAAHALFLEFKELLNEQNKQKLATSLWERAWRRATNALVTALVLAATAGVQFALWRLLAAGHSEVSISLAVAAAAGASPVLLSFIVGVLLGAHGLLRDAGAHVAAAHRHAAHAAAALGALRGRVLGDARGAGGLPAGAAGRAAVAAAAAGGGGGARNALQVQRAAQRARLRHRVQLADADLQPGRAVAGRAVRAAAGAGRDAQAAAAVLRQARDGAAHVPRRQEGVARGADADRALHAGDALAVRDALRTRLAVLEVVVADVRAVPTVRARVRDRQRRPAAAVAPRHAACRAALRGAARPHRLRAAGVVRVRVHRACARRRAALHGAPAAADAAPAGQGQGLPAGRHREGVQRRVAVQAEGGGARGAGGGGGQPHVALPARGAPPLQRGLPLRRLAPRARRRPPQVPRAGAALLPAPARRRRHRQLLQLAGLRQRPRPRGRRRGEELASRARGVVSRLVCSL
ncbi:uncharacterized protein [Maniola hyperantus]|uniref:uncharacterized protein isoform X1 n=1 Tax=Aphantopus hyperantus TaxID=2795564 RepID=UPI00374794C0